MLGPGDSGYDEARRVFLPAVDRRPAAIVRPTDAGEVARIVALAAETDLELAIRGGGHGYAGHGTSEGGIVLDLGGLRMTELDTGARIVRAAGGLTSGEVTTAAAPHGLAVGFGDTASVGIGGLTLGGGIGFLVRKHGLTIDHLLGAEVVTADGRVSRSTTSAIPTSSGRSGAAAATSASSPASTTGCTRSTWSRAGCSRCRRRRRPSPGWWRRRRPRRRTCR